MWLINVRTQQLEEFLGLDVPSYAILSHTWARGEEVTFQEMRRHSAAANPAARSKKSGWLKIDHTCRLAARSGLGYAWVDTCCIDKSSSAELSEAINSMFRWYGRAAVCYVFLSDLCDYFFAGGLLPAGEEERPGDFEGRVGRCRWFTRSWTLQELIAPRRMLFFDADWRYCFSKEAESGALSSITGIGVDVLTNEKDLSSVSVAQKMSWAAGRQATRKEDVAYSLLGIFGINMPMLYGEEERAFLRLQAQIISSCPDTTIFAWVHPKEDSEDASQDQSNTYSGVLAPSPAAFELCAKAASLSGESTYEFSMSNRGIKLHAQFGVLPLKDSNNTCLVLPVCWLKGRVYGVRMRNTGGGCFVRQDPYSLFRVGPRALAYRLVFDPYLLTGIPPDEGGKSIVLKSRERVLEVVMPQNMKVFWRWPWQQWDEQDAVFFGPERSSEGLGWASLKVVAWPQPCFLNGPEAPTTVSFLFYALGWAKDPGAGSLPCCTVHRVRGTADSRALEQINNDAVRHCWNACRLTNRLRSNSVSEQDFSVAGETETTALLLEYAISCVEDPKKCLNPFWRVAFSWRVVPKDQKPIASTRNWADVKGYTSQAVDNPLDFVEDCKLLWKQAALGWEQSC